MRVGLLSDVHANIDALSAAIKDGQKNGVDRWWFLGDAVGRGPAPVETMDYLRQYVNTRHWLTGNHDFYVASGVPPLDVNDNDNKIWRDHYIRLQDKQQNGKRQMWTWCQRAWQLNRAEPRRVRSNTFDCWLVHAALGDQYMNAGDSDYSYIWPWDHTRACAQMRLLLNEYARPGRPCLLIHGHTHVPYVATKLPGDNIVRLLPILYDDENRLSVINIEAMMINPGSVGQPRNGDKWPHAAYGILDLAQATFSFHRVTYDPGNMQRKMKGLKYPEHFIELLDGRHPGTKLNSPLWGKWDQVYEAVPNGWKPRNPDWFAL